jgi:hypothetical protein
MLHHFIITRFSIYDNNSTSFKLTRKTRKNQIKSKLFNTQRLDFKFKVFDKMTYPSIQNQTCKNYSWLIYASDYLPEKYKEKLNTYSNKHTKIIYVKNFSEMNSNLSSLLKNKENYTTVRLDDDDGLHSDFLQHLNQYKNDKGKIISFPYGILFKLRGNKIIYKKRPFYFKKIALGLSAIGFNIYSAGGHTHVDEKYNVIYNNLKKAYYLCASEFCDTKRSFTRKYHRIPVYTPPKDSS